MEATTRIELVYTVLQTDAAIVEEARERDPPLEHVIHGLGDVVAARELGTLLAHSGLQLDDQRRAELLPNGPAPFGALTVDRPLDLEPLIDPTTVGSKLAHS